MDYSKRYAGPRRGHREKFRLRLNELNQYALRCGFNQASVARSMGVEDSTYAALLDGRGIVRRAHVAAAELALGLRPTIAQYVAERAERKTVYVRAPEAAQIAEARAKASKARELARHAVAQREHQSRTRAIRILRDRVQTPLQQVDH